MNKKFLLLSICIIVVFLAVVLIINFTYSSITNIKNTQKTDVIANKETAIKIGRSLLEEHFPDYFLNNYIAIDAEEKDGIWRVHNVLQRHGIAQNGDKYILLGGEIYVEFRKSNGKVINIGIND